MNRWGRRRAATAAATVAAGAFVLAGCGQQIYGAQAGGAAAASAAKLAVAANAGCVRATPAVEQALGVLGRLQRGTVTAAQARRQLNAGLGGLERLARSTPADVLQESLQNAVDAFTAFRVVMSDRHAPAYRDTLTNLAGTLSGFPRTCSVAGRGSAAGPHSQVAASGNTVLTRSATGHDGQLGLRVANAGTSGATAGFTDSPTALSTTLEGSEQIGLWARALSGRPTLTLRVRELSDHTVVGSGRVTMTLGPAFRFGYLTYRVRRPGASRLSVTVSAAGLGHGGSFLVDDITIVRH